MCWRSPSERSLPRALAVRPSCRRLPVCRSNAAFLIAPALARLIQRECSGVSRIVEGHFHPNPQRTQLVRVERDHALLILFVRGADGTMAEERAEVPIAHAEALIDVAPGRVAFDRLLFGLTAEAGR